MVVSDVASLVQWEDAKIHILLRPEYAMLNLIRKRREGKE